MVKKVFISLFILTVLLGTALLAGNLSNRNQEPGPDIVNTPSFPQGDETNPSTQPSNQNLQGAVRNGQITVLNDNGQQELLRIAGFVENDEEVLAADFSKLFDNRDFSEYFDILYDRRGGSITVYLHELPLSFARDVATDRLLESLGVSIETLCELNVNVQTNQFVDPDFTGQDLGLTGCPGAVALP